MKNEEKKKIEKKKKRKKKEILLEVSSVTDVGAGVGGHV